MYSDTIYAQSSAHGRAGVTIFRLSGTHALDAINKMLKAPLERSSIKARYAYLKDIYKINHVNVSEKNHNQLQDELIDKAIIIFFPKNNSFTGEEIIEIHAHGSIAICKLLIKQLGSIDFVRHAEPGEFTKRAFLNGKFDLTSAEGLVDLINSDTEMQHKQAIKQMEGGLEKFYNKLRIDIIEIMSLVEAFIDFPDEDIPAEVIEQSHDKIKNIANQIKSHLNDNNNGERLRNGISLAITGKPNSGKSSLINMLFNRELSIISEIAGTTRDVIEGHLDIAGYPFILQDTAGIRDNTLDQIESIGIEKAKNTAEKSDINVIIIDLKEIFDDQESYKEILNQNLALKLWHDNSIILLNKIDLINNIEENQGKNQLITQIKNHIKFCVKSGGKENIDSPKTQEVKIIEFSNKEKFNLNLLQKEIENIAHQIAIPTHHPQITRERHRNNLTKALLILENISFKNDLILTAEDLRMSANHLSNLTGKIIVDDILEQIFSSFCIGK